MLCVHLASDASEFDDRAAIPAWRRVQPPCRLVLIVTVVRVPQSQSLEAVTHTFTPQRGDSPVRSKINVSGGDVHVASREPTIEPIRSGPSAIVR